MGLILLPLLLFWFAFAVFGLIQSWAVLVSFENKTQQAIFIVTTLTILISYCYLGFSQFKSAKSLWSFEIIMFFSSHKLIFLAAIGAQLTLWYGQKLLTEPWLKAIPLSVILTVSMGALFSSFYSDTFMENHHIERTH